MNGISNNYPKLEQMDNIKIKKPSIKINWNDFLNSLSTVPTETVAYGFPVFSTIKLFMSINKELNKPELLYELIFNSLIHTILYNAFKSSEINTEKEFWEKIYDNFNEMIKDKTLNMINLNLIIEERLSEISLVNKICENFNIDQNIYNNYFYEEIKNTKFFNFIGNQYRQNKLLEDFGSLKSEKLTSNSDRNIENDITRFIEKDKYDKKKELEFKKEKLEYENLEIKKQINKVNSELTSLNKNMNLNLEEIKKIDKKLEILEK